MRAAANDVRKKDTETEGVFKPERDARQDGWFCPGEEDVVVTESRADRPERKSGRRRCQGEAQSNPGVKTEEDVGEERRSEQIGHVLGRMWPSQVQSKNETGNWDSGICFFNKIEGGVGTAGNSTGEHTHN
ncbi:hypothetical protein NDU88_010544 [Pleurodeles waltl]|uniref:Uncharacterized protein n=1 Tax=Pleurodeles waltl TaxID=8319 RepID=A0AAV7S1J7_PLEWA|nr:hypothetical protein NDU88_010544 [Pleurodeles waltl]